MAIRKPIPDLTGKFYAGIGARKTPLSILRAMEGLAAFLAKTGYILRSGGADGADTAFETGCDHVQGDKEIFLPWENFNDNKSRYYRLGTLAYEIAEKHHPAWDSLSQAGKKFMARNVYQIEGKAHEELAEFIVCWTPNGQITGGTGQALRMAKYHKIPVFNFGDTSMEKLEQQILKQIRKNSNDATK